MYLSNKKLFIILGAATAALAGATTLAIFITPSSTEHTSGTPSASRSVDPSFSSMISQPSFPADDESALAIKSLTEAYYTPGIYTYNRDTRDSNNALTGITIDNLSALKNQDLQSKINRQIQTSCQAAWDENIQLTTKKGIGSDIFDGYYGTANCAYNMSIGNLLSTFSKLYVPYEGTVNILDGYSANDAPVISVPHSVTAKNYRLDTGEEIKFGDLFVSGTDLTPIITKAIAEAIHCRTEYCGGGLQWYAKIDDVEAEALRLIQSFRTADDIPFHFDSRTITLWVENYELSIRMEEWADKIAIFKRFAAADNPYKDTPVIPQFIFSSTTPDYKNDFVSDNLFARVSFSADDSVPQAVVDKNRTLTDSIITKAIAATKNLPGFYILDFENHVGESTANAKYYNSISVGCSACTLGIDNYCAEFGKIPLVDPSKTAALDAIATASRSIYAQFYQGLDIVSVADNNINFWSSIDGYTIDEDSELSHITLYYDESGNLTQE